MHPLRRFGFVALALAAVTAALLVACGGGGDDNKTSTSSEGTVSLPTFAAATSTSAAATATTAPAAAAATATTAPPAPTNTSAPPPPAATNTSVPPPPSASASVSVFNFGYNPASLSATHGQQISITVTNTGANSHTFTINGVAGADTNSISPGGSATITFTVPASGPVTYFCKIHGQATMSGTLNIQ